MNINLTRQQLAILGGLLLAGYLVFCGFGCVLGMGMREPAVANVSQETVRPTLIPTDTPVPTNTPVPPVPTATRTKVFPAVTPTRVFHPTLAPPADTPIPAGPSLEAQLYLLEVVPKMEPIAKALGCLSELLLYPKYYDQDWIIAVSVEMVVIQLAHEELAAMDVPPEMVEIHSAILDATSDFSAAMDYLSSGLDNLSMADLETAAALMTSGSEKMEKAVRMAEEYAAQFE